MIRDAVMAQVEIAAGPFRVVSLMSRQAADELGLEAGVVAVAVIKSTNVVVEIPGTPRGESVGAPVVQASFPLGRRGPARARAGRGAVRLRLATAPGHVPGLGLGPPERGRTLTVFAAASLTETFTELGKTFEAAHPGTTVRFNFGASADPGPADRPGRPGRRVRRRQPGHHEDRHRRRRAAGAPTHFVRNQLEIAVPADNPAKVDDLKDLTDPKVKVALCAEQVPCGAAAVRRWTRPG